MNYNTIKDTDSDILAKAKREYIALSAELVRAAPATPTFANTAKKIHNIQVIIELLTKLNEDKTRVIDLYEINKTLEFLLNDDVLCPLTLEDNEFENGINKRCKRYVKAENPNDIINVNAFNLYVRRSYNLNTQCEIDLQHTIVPQTYAPRLYINKGGIVHTEFISKCFLYREEIAEHNYTPKPIITIPCSIIKVGNHSDDIVYAVDHRDPMLKQLREEYLVPIEKDKNCPIINIRKFKKLKRDE